MNCSLAQQFARHRERIGQMLRQQMGLDDPLLIRYARWMGLWPDVNGELNGLIEGNFGTSQFFKQSVVEVIKDPMKNTIFINIFQSNRK